MYRVLLKVDKVSLRIKQCVELSIQIRKNQKQFLHCKKQTLVNGEITLTNTSQFFICTKQPSFCIEIYLIMGQVKKKGGVVNINLNHFDINASHRIKAPLQQIPIPNCSLYLDFVYMISSKTYQGNEMYSLQELQNINHKQYLQSISTQHQKLVSAKNRLNGQIEEMKMKNQILQGENNNLLLNYELRKMECENQIEVMEVQRDNSQQTLGLQKKKIAEIVGLINESKNSELISQAKVIMDSTPSQHKPK